MERIFSLIVKVILQAITSGSKTKAETPPEPEPEIKKEDPKPEPLPAKEKKVTHQKKYLWLLDNGHGDTTPGKRSPKFDDGTQMFEYEFDRVALAKSCDDQGLEKVYISVHGNAATDDWSSANGVETFCYPGSTTGHRLSDVFQKHLIDQTGWRDRGVKEANFYVLRKTTMPAILTENGFFSNKQQCEQMLSAEYRDKIAEAHVQAILEIEKDSI